MKQRSESESIDGVLRRTVLKASAVAAGALAASTPAIAGDDGDEASEDGNETDEDENESTADGAVDEPDGFEVDVIAGHAPFTDDLSATFDLAFADDGDDPIEIELEDASTIIVAEVTWTAGGTSGWHRHPGVVIVNVVEGEIEVTWERDCVPRTYAAGESFFDPGVVHLANSAEGATAYATFVGIPDGEPATEWVEPVDC